MLPYIYLCRKETIFASRGIGLELTKQLLTNLSNVIVATCRNPPGANDLHALKDTAKGTLHIARIDVSDEDSIRDSVKVVEELLGENASIDYLYNNAAINEGNDTAFTFSSAVLMRTIQANVIGPAVMSQCYLHLLEKSQKKTIINITSGLASIGLDLGPKCATYTISKTALNMLAYKQKTERPDFTVIVLDPGWVKTVMGGEGAILEPEESVSNIIRTVTGLKHEDSGKFFQYDGGTIAW
ncbi:C-factor [Lentinus tigrinus ALCF2SS1-7]|uniref:C-factor n=1 Tax=Lentinus tigrinus ALCF2SS1-6 TaxID=1328759 RepID=A0A5C2SAX7_9APHY|nr:C-factor [Lentinus tigrinus ALCF2SS1-6]RPD70945.1 C-factor [Lentinus tigrinus ALCF2SS1-7]